MGCIERIYKEIEKMKDEIIKKQINLFKEVYEAVVLEAKNPDQIQHINLETVIHIYHEVNKDLRVINMKADREERDNKPSQKQIDYARDLGIINPEKYTKQELGDKINVKAPKRR